MIYQVGKKQCSNTGRKRNDIDPLESDFMVQPPSLREFPGPLTPPPPWNFQFPLWWGSGYFLEPHIKCILYRIKLQMKVCLSLRIVYLHNRKHKKWNCTNCSCFPRLWKIVKITHKSCHNIEKDRVEN